MNHQSEIYRDTGCRFFPKCLECPFPVCLLDNLDSFQSKIRKAEARELAEQGLSQTEIASRLNVSVSQVSRYLHNSIDNLT